MSGAIKLALALLSVIKSALDYCRLRGCGRADNRDPDQKKD